LNVRELIEALEGLNEPEATVQIETADFDEEVTSVEVVNARGGKYVILCPD